MRSTVLTRSNSIAFAAGLLIGIWSWQGSPSSFALMLLSKASGIGWLFVLSVLATVIAFGVGYSESHIGHLARVCHAWLHRNVTVRQQKAVSFLLGLIIFPTLAAVVEGNAAHFEVVLLSLLLIMTFGFYGYGLNAMADRLRIRGYLPNE